MAVRYGAPLSCSGAREGKFAESEIDLCLLAQSLGVSELDTGTDPGIEACVGLLPVVVGCGDAALETRQGGLGDVAVDVGVANARLELLRCCVALMLRGFFAALGDPVQRQRVEVENRYAEGEGDAVVCDRRNPAIGVRFGSARQLPAKPYMTPSRASSGR